MWDDYKVYAFHKSVFDFLASDQSGWGGDSGSLSVAFAREDHNVVFERLSKEMRESVNNGGELSDYCLHQVVFHGREGGCILDAVVGSLDFWVATVKKG